MIFSINIKINEKAQRRFASLFKVALVLLMIIETLLFVACSKEENIPAGDRVALRVSALGISDRTDEEIMRSYTDIPDVLKFSTTTGSIDGYSVRCVVDKPKM